MALLSHVPTLRPNAPRAKLESRGPFYQRQAGKAVPSGKQATKEMSTTDK